MLHEERTKVELVKKSGEKSEYQKACVKITWTRDVTAQHSH